MQTLQTRKRQHLQIPPQQIPLRQQPLQLREMTLTQFPQTLNQIVIECHHLEEGEGELGQPGDLVVGDGESAQGGAVGEGVDVGEFVAAEVEGGQAL